MKLSFQHFILMAGLIGLTASPALGQSSGLPPLHCVSPSPCFVPSDGIPVPLLEIVPWDDPRATDFLINELIPEIPPGTNLSDLVAEFGASAVVQALQSNLTDPALIDSFGRLILELAKSSPDPLVVAQASDDLAAFLRAKLSPSVVPGEPPIVGTPGFLAIVAEVISTLSPEEIAAINSSPEAFQAFVDSLVPRTASNQATLTQYGQEWVYRYLQDRLNLHRRLRQQLNTVSETPRETLDLSGLQVNGLPLAERGRLAGRSTATVNHSVQAEVEAYQTAYSATALLKEDSLEPAPEEGVQESDQPTELTDTTSPWAAFLSGDIAWGTTQNVDTFDLNNYVILAGADYTLNPNVTLGGMLSYSTGNQRNNISRANADSIAFSLYGSGSYGSGGYATGFMSYGFDSFNSRRTILIPGFNREAIGSSSGNQFNIGAETGWSFVAGGVFLQPSLGLRYTTSSIGGYTETGAGTLSAIINSYSTNSTIAELGFDVAYPIATGDRYIMPFAGVGLNQRLSYSGPEVTAQFVGGGGAFIIPAPNADYTWIDLSLGVSADLSPRTVGQLVFRTDLARSDASINNFSINLRHDF